MRPVFSRFLSKVNIADRVGLQSSEEGTKAGGGIRGEDSDLTADVIDDEAVAEVSLHVSAEIWDCILLDVVGCIFDFAEHSFIAFIKRAPPFFGRMSILRFLAIRNLEYCPFDLRPDGLRVECILDVSETSFNLFAS